MKRFFSCMIAFLLLSACAQGQTDEEIPTPTPSPSPVATPESEVTTDASAAEEPALFEYLLQWENAIDEDGLSDDKIYTFANGETRRYASDEYILWFDGQFVTDKVLEIDGELYIPASLSEILETTAEGWTKYVDDVAFVSGEKAADALGMSYKEFTVWRGEKRDYLTDASEIILADNPIIAIGGYTTADGDVNLAMFVDELIAGMNKAYSAFEDAILDDIESINGGRLANWLDEDFFNDTLWILRERIDELRWIGSFGQYLVFEGPYVTLLDTTTGDVYFYQFAYLIGGLGKADFNSKELFIPMYFSD